MLKCQHSWTNYFWRCTTSTSRWGGLGGWKWNTSDQKRPTSSLALGKLDSIAIRGLRKAGCCCHLWPSFLMSMRYLRIIYRCVIEPVHLCVFSSFTCLCLKKTRIRNCRNSWLWFYVSSLVLVTLWSGQDPKSKIVIDVAMRILQRIAKRERERQFTRILTILNSQLL